MMSSPYYCLNNVTRNLKIRNSNQFYFIKNLTVEQRQPACVQVLSLQQLDEFFDLDTQKG